MTMREIYRQELALRGIRHKDMLEAEEWADKRQPFAAALMNMECPPHAEPMMHRLLGELADQVYAPIRMRQ